ncbi:MAG: diguanylate cyclase (GGDEF)-like protein [Hyphomicrobiaceae bacterium]|jgi:diguanylate cyclase (GGDEF)-like protein
MSRLFGSTSHRLTQAILDPASNLDIFGITEVVSDWVWVTDCHDRFTYLSPQVEKHIALPPEHFLGRTREESAAFSAATDLSKLQVIIGRRDSFQDHLLCWSGNDDVEHFVELSGKPFWDEIGNFIGYLGSGRDVSDRTLKEREIAEAQQQLQQQALQDHLTKLPNRRALEQYIAQISNAPLVGPDSIAALCADIDGFKEINDAKGHAVGDRCLRKIARLLQSLIPEDCFFSRVGGDEFVILCPGIDLAGGQRLANELSAKIDDKLIVGDADLKLTLSLGVAALRQTGRQILQCITDADLALHQGKAQHKASITPFTDNLRRKIRKHRQLKSELAGAIEADQILPVYQPRFDALTLQVIGAEALARWQHPTGTLWAPGYFLDVADEIGALNRIDQEIFRKALQDREQWPRHEQTPLHLSVNVSPARILSPTLLDDVASCKHSIEQVSFELVETIWFDALPADVKERLEMLKARGIGIELDDFGAGHASITGLLASGADTVKIDRGLTSNIETDSRVRRLFESLVKMLLDLGYRVVAEGIENERQYQIARDAGCAEIQGYWLARPMEQEAFITFCQEHMPISPQKITGSAARNFGQSGKTKLRQNRQASLIS